MSDLRTLIIGRGRPLFWDLPEVLPSYVEVVDEVHAGIHRAAEESFGIVAVVVQQSYGRLESVLQALREHAAGKIVLLVQMFEEPIARRLVQAPPGEAALADDYLVCPASIAWLCHSGEEKDVSQPTPAIASSGGDALKDRIRHLERLATEDDLTGLKNRRYVWEFSQQILAYAQREKGRVTLLVYDIDNFKHYNDEFGHTTGDSILKEAAVLMRRCCRAHDVVGRIGGDEFAVVFWDDPQTAATESDRRAAQAQHPREAIFIAHRFQEGLKASEFRGLGAQGAGVLTISGGLASYPDDGETIQELFAKADTALLEAKRSGKNRIYLVGGPAAGSA